MNLLEQLKATVGPANVLTEPADTAPYLTDWRKRYTGRAQAVVRPATTDEVVAVAGDDRGRPQLAGAATGLLMQGSNIGGLLGPPITGALVAGAGWPSAAWLTSTALGVAAAAGLFLHWREKRTMAAAPQGKAS